MRFKPSGTCGLAEAASPVFSEVPGCECVPVPANEFLPTGMAIGAAAFFIMHIPGIDISQAVVHRDGVGQGQGRRGGARRFKHFEIRMKGGKMQGHVWSQKFHHP